MASSLGSGLKDRAPSASSLATNLLHQTQDPRDCMTPLGRNGAVLTSFNPLVLSPPQKIISKQDVRVCWGKTESPAEGTLQPRVL